MSIQKQQRQLDNVPDVVIATPGRLWEILSNSDPLLDRLRRIKFLVLDEADRMLEFGHYQELSSILKAISLRHAEGSADAENQEVNERQTLVFSATLAKADFVNKSSSGKRVTSEKGISMRELS
jgi:ATP-dependent RNA helicase DDX24/MAK5